MVTVLIFLAIFLSFFCSFVLKKQYAAVLLVIIASCRVAITINSVIIMIFFAALLHFFHTFLETKQNKSLLLILLLPITFILSIFLIQPYKINFFNYLGYLSALFIFAWVMLLKWDSETIIKFLTVYGLFLLLAGFLEKTLTDNLRIGHVLTVATAYAVILVVTWTIWTISIFLSKKYSINIIFLGTFLVFLAIVFSGTRMGLIGIILGLGLCGLSAAFTKNKNISIIKVVFYPTCIIASLLLFSVITWTLLPNDLRIKKAFSALIEGKIDMENMGRVVIWASSINIIEKNKFLGIGSGNFHIEYKKILISAGLNNIPVHTIVGHANSVHSHSHNIYLMILTEHGIVGFLVLSVFVFFCLLQPFLYFLKERREGRQCPEFFALSSGFIVMVILGATDSMGMLLPTTGFSAWLLGVCASLRERRLNCLQK